VDRVARDLERRARFVRDSRTAAPGLEMRRASRLTSHDGEVGHPTQEIRFERGGAASLWVALGQYVPATPE
jgi:hypothetical protein